MQAGDGADQEIGNIVTQASPQTRFLPLAAVSFFLSLVIRVLLVWALAGAPELFFTSPVPLSRGEKGTAKIKITLGMPRLLPHRLRLSTCLPLVLLRSGAGFSCTSVFRSTPLVVEQLSAAGGSQTTKEAETMTFKTGSKPVKEIENPRPKLWIYDHCPFCIRPRWEHFACTAFCSSPQLAVGRQKVRVWPMRHMIRPCLRTGSKGERDPADRSPHMYDAYSVLVGQVDVRWTQVTQCPDKAIPSRSPPEY